MPEDTSTPPAGRSRRRSARAQQRSASRSAALRSVGRSAAGATLVVGLVTTGWVFATSEHSEPGSARQVTAVAADTEAGAEDRVPQIGDAVVVEDVAEAGVLRSWLRERAKRPGGWPRPPWWVAPGPGPVEPGPVDPAPVEPGPVDPAPVEPGPVEPGPVDPAPVEPGPVEPGPVDPAPVEPGPVDPGPVDPGPVDPKPVDPKPVDPKPVDPKPVDPKPVDPAPSTPEQVYSADLVRLVNAERAATGLRPLAVNECASQAAQEWAEYLAKSGEFKHQDLSAVSKRCGFTRGAGENIALHWETAPKMVQMWMGSPGHKSNILGSGYGAIGSGVARNSKGAWIGVHVFVVGTPAAR